MNYKKIGLGILKILWYLFIAYAVLQIIAVIILAFFIPELAKTLILSVVVFGLGWGVGYLKGMEDGK